LKQSSSPPPIAEVRLGLSGKVRVYCIRPDGTVRADSVIEQSNLITNAGLNALASATPPNVVSSLCTHVGVGTGSTAPAAGDTALQTPVNLGGVARTNLSHTNDGSVSANDVVATYRRVRKFPAATGPVTLREFGFFSAATGGIMWNRELFRNELGTAIDYTVLEGEELVMDLLVSLTIPPSDVSTSFTLTFNDNTPDQTISVVIRPMLTTNAGTAWNPNNVGYSYFAAVSAAAADGITGLVTRGSSFSGTNSSSSLVGAYVAGTFYLDVTYTWEPANFTTTINRFKFGGWLFQMTVSPGIPKTSAKRLRLTIRYVWGRA
jgi:hypothetical protein